MRTLLSLTIGAVLLLALGCSDQPSSPAPTAATTPTEGEAPAEVTALLEANTPDALPSASTESESWTAWPPYEYIKNCDVYAVTILWGQLYNSATPAATATDWSGRLWVNGVSVVQARRTIDFETGEDSLITEADSAAAAWVSKTAVDFDGISFLVFVRRDIVYIMAPTLHFETAPLSFEFGFGELAKLDKFYLLPSGNAAAIHARQIWPRRCPGGFMEGKWIKDDNAGASGQITGLWLGYDGEPQGVIAGHFWTNNDGTREYSGYISGYYLTVVIGQFKGTWRYDDPRMCVLCGSGHGWFRGVFTWENGTNKGGVMMGEIGDFLSPDVSALELPFTGIWSDFCAWTPEEIGSDNTP